MLPPPDSLLLTLCSAVDHSLTCPQACLLFLLSFLPTLLYVYIFCNFADTLPFQLCFVHYCILFSLTILNFSSFLLLLVYGSLYISFVFFIWACSLYVLLPILPGPFGHFPLPATILVIPDAGR